MIILTANLNWQSKLIWSQVSFSSITVSVLPADSYYQLVCFAAVCSLCMMTIPKDSELKDLQTVVANAPTIHELWRHGYGHIKSCKFGKDACPLEYTLAVRAATGSTTNSEVGETEQLNHQPRYSQHRPSRVGHDIRVSVSFSSLEHPHLDSHMCNPRHRSESSMNESDGASTACKSNREWKSHRSQRWDEWMMFA